MCFYKINASRTFHKIEKDNKFPTHTEFYRDLHLIEDGVVRYIFKHFDWTFEKKGWFGTKTTEYNVKFEEKYWDMVIHITKTPEKTLIYDSNFKFVTSLYTEYKSSLHEFGKQIDDYFRQIKKKERDNENPILLSFDPRFNEYKEACKRADIDLIVLPKEILDKIK